MSEHVRDGGVVIPLATAERCAAVLTPGCYLLAGRLPHLCRPSAAYLLRQVTAPLVFAEVVYSPGSPALVGRQVAWPTGQIAAAWRLGDVRVVARWQEPTETLVASRDRRMDPRGAVPAPGQAAIAAGG